MMDEDYFELLPVAEIWERALQQDLRKNYPAMKGLIMASKAVSEYVPGPKIEGEQLTPDHVKKLLWEVVIFTNEDGSEEIGTVVEIVSEIDESYILVYRETLLMSMMHTVEFRSPNWIAKALPKK